MLFASETGGTCLINSVQSEQLCSYLISKGADVNAKDIQNKTALHYAIQEHRYVYTLEIYYSFQASQLTPDLIP